jgi:hypothetical protein
MLVRDECRKVMNSQRQEQTLFDFNKRHVHMSADVWAFVLFLVSDVTMVSNTKRRMTYETLPTLCLPQIGAIHSHIEANGPLFCCVV